MIGDIIARLSAIEISLFESVYPCDLYYEDLDGEWIMVQYYEDSVLYDHLDGSGDVAPEIYIGRILPKRSAGNDSVLINNYLDRIHNLRLGNYTIERGYRALGFFDDDWAGWTSHQPDKWRIHDNQVKQGFSHRDIWATPWGAIEDTTIRDYYAGKNTLYPQLENQYEWVRVMVHGNRAIQWFKYFGNWETSQVISDDISWSNRCMFFDLFTCEAGIYSMDDYLASFYLFNTTTDWKTVGLITSAKSGGLIDGADFYRFFGRGLPLGKAFLKWFQIKGVNGFDEYERGWYYGMTVLGDPTLHSYNFTYGLDEYADFPYNPDSTLTGAQFVDIDLDGTDEILIFNKNGIALYELDGSLVWTKQLSNNEIYKPAIGDIDNDGQLEIVVGLSNIFGELIALDKDGIELFNISTNGITSPPVIFDFDNDGEKEIVVAQTLSIDPKGYKVIQVFDNEGNETWNYQTQARGGAEFPSVGDINGDGTFELVWMSDKRDDTVYAFTYSSGFTELWKKYITGIGGTSLSLGDARNLGKEDIIVGANGVLYILDGTTGDIISSFDVDSIPVAPIFANIDDDPYLEPMTITESGRFYIFPDIVTNTGISLDKLLPFNGSSSPSIADITGDNIPEILLPTFKGVFLLYNDGTKVWNGEYFGKRTEFSGVITDVDGDGNIEYGYGDYFGGVHLQPLNTGIAKYSWLEGRSDRWNTGNTTDRVPPLPPSGLTAEVEWTGYPSRCIVHLDWNDNKDIDLDHYNVYERISGTTEYILIGSSVSSSYDRLLYPQPNKSYFYYVKAVDKEENFSSHSNVVCGGPYPPHYGRGKGQNLALYVDLGKEEPSEFVLRRDGIEKDPEIKDFTLYPDFDADKGEDTLLYSIPSEYAGNHLILTVNPCHLLIRTGSNAKETRILEKGNICIFTLPENINNDNILLQITSLDGNPVEVSEMLIMRGSKNVKTNNPKDLEIGKTLISKGVKISQTFNKLIIASEAGKSGYREIEIFNISGRKVYSRNFTNVVKKTVIDTHIFPSGVYFVKVSGAVKVKAFRKVMIIK